ncbi:MAG: sulfotransferase domain-containing protein [Deltaproteobacteria bacterium]|nr:sulfotransferase domain-containing protein [Deltaproteobacteria bacterium]
MPQILQSPRNEYSYLIIGGTTRAATSSLFRYLSAHPEICASSMKETRFFLDRDYPVPVKRIYTGDIREYQAFFTNGSGTIRLEATPDYLYSVGTPQRLLANLDNIQLVFILRNPISRLISWYGFARQNSLLPLTVDFDEYISMQLRAADRQSNSQHLQILAQGKYSRYLENYYRLFGKESIFVGLYEDLVQSPMKTIVDICTFIGVDAGFYETFDFAVYNRSWEVRSTRMHHYYRLIQSRIRNKVHRRPMLHQRMRRLKKALHPVYLALNVKSHTKVSVNPETCNKLRQYYREENTALMKLTGFSSPPWPALDT